jgi:hypothetical protein
VADPTLRILCAKRNGLILQLENAKRDRRHDDITPIAAELSQTRARIVRRMTGQERLERDD